MRRGHRQGFGDLVVPAGAAAGRPRSGDMSPWPSRRAPAAPGSPFPAQLGHRTSFDGLAQIGGPAMGVRWGLRAGHGASRLALSALSALLVLVLAAAAPARAAEPVRPAPPRPAPLPRSPEWFLRVDGGGRARPASGRGAGMHGVRGTSGDVRVLGPGFLPDLRPRAPPSPRLSTLRNHTPELRHILQQGPCLPGPPQKEPGRGRGGGGGGYPLGT